MKPLTEKQFRFVDALFGPGPGYAVHAARAAGYACPGSQGSRLLAMHHVAAEVAARHKARSALLHQKWQAQLHARLEPA